MSVFILKAVKELIITKCAINKIKKQARLTKEQFKKDY